MEKHKYTILFIEDDEEIRKNYVNTLKNYYKQVYQVDSGVIAYEIYLDKKPDILTVDINIFDMSGLELIKKIRKFDHSTRIIILTSYSDIETLLQATELKLTKYLVKPVKRRELIESLNLAIEEINNFSTTSNEILVLKNNFLWSIESGQLFYKNELMPSTNTDTTVNTNLVANEKFLTQIYTNSYLNIQKGWNLLSNPTSEPLNIASKFKYATKTMKYDSVWKQNPKTLNQNEGMWVNYSKHISEKIEGESYQSDFTNATSGWNLFGAGRDISLSELNSFNEVWAYDSKVKEWVKNPSIIYRGYGFWAK